MKITALLAARNLVAGKPQELVFDVYADFSYVGRATLLRRSDGVLYPPNWEWRDTDLSGWLAMATPMPSEIDVIRAAQEALAET